MKKTKFYTYLGTNGTLVSAVHLENIYSVESFALTAENGKVLTKDGGKTYLTHIINVPKDEVDLWEEIDIPGQK